MQESVQHKNTLARKPQRTYTALQWNQNARTDSGKPSSSRSSLLLSSFPSGCGSRSRSSSTARRWSRPSRRANISSSTSSPTTLRRRGAAMSSSSAIPRTRQSFSSSASSGSRARPWNLPGRTRPPASLWRRRTLHTRRIVPRSRARRERIRHVRLGPTNISSWATTAS